MDLSEQLAPRVMGAGMPNGLEMSRPTSQG